MESLPIRTPFPGASCFLLRSTASTQAEARRLAEGRGPAGLCFPPGSLVLAEEQSAGRGRFPDRAWESEAGKNLLFTLFLEPGLARLPALPIRIGLALCRASERYALASDRAFPSPPRLKWPNDLMFGERKAAGILCEAGASGVFAGIGLNCNQIAFPPSIEPRSTSLARELGGEIGRWELLEAILDELAAALVDALWRAKAEELLWRRGESSTFLPGLSGEGGRKGDSPLSGRIEGLGEDGSLLFREAGSPVARPYAAGELSHARNLVDRGPPAL
jgi:BirA family transcriptional regulator, biotin operon repressor / biotin---[acetyl-CoA-carboxylase] ligase